jgi:hypothetical protein
VSTIEEPLGRNVLENREYGRGDRLRCPRDTLHPQKLALTSPTSGSCSVGLVRSRTKAMEFVFIVFWGEGILYPIFMEAEKWIVLFCMYNVHVKLVVIVYRYFHSNSISDTHVSLHGSSLKLSMAKP